MFALAESQFEGVPWLAQIKIKKKCQEGLETVLVLLQVSSISGTVTRKARLSYATQERLIASMTLFGY